LLKLTVQHTKQLLKWLDTNDPEWFIQKDLTGRLKSLKAAGRLSDCFVLASQQSQSRLAVSFHVIRPTDYCSSQNKTCKAQEQKHTDIIEEPVPQS
jgi:hypothetical protein